MTNTAMPKVGMGATIRGWSDCYPATVVKVSKNGRVITVQEDTATRVDGNGISECQEYTYTPNPKGSTRTYSLRKDGRWLEKGDYVRCCYLALGYRRKFHDYSF